MTEEEIDREAKLLAKRYHEIGLTYKPPSEASAAESYRILHTAQTMELSSSVGAFLAQIDSESEIEKKLQALIKVISLQTEAFARVMIKIIKAQEA